MAAERRAVIVTQVYPPETHPTGLMVEQLAQRLIDGGWRVSVAAGLSHHPTGVVPPQQRGRLVSRTRSHGIEVFRVWHPTTRSRRTLHRAAMLSQQAIAAAIAGALPSALRSVEVVICFGPPLVGPAAAAALAWARRAALVNVIHDLYPAIAIDTGHLHNRGAIAAARALEHLQYRAAHATVVLGERLRQRVISAGAPAARTFVIPPWLSPGEISARPHRGRGDQFVVLCAGTQGVISNAEVIAAAAARLRDTPGVLFRCVGRGAGFDALAHRARFLPNVELAPPRRRAAVDEMLAGADACLVTLAPGRGQTSFPSKLVAYLAAGRPIIAAVDADCDTAAAVRDGKAGIICAPGDGRALAEAVLSLRADVAARARLGRAARATFERHFAAPGVLEGFTELVTAVAEHRALAAST